MTEDDNKAFDEAVGREVEAEQGEHKVTSEDIDFIFEVMKKEAPYEELSLKQITYGCFSAFTKLPLHHNVNSRKSGAGKTYDLTLPASYFPDKYVLLFIGMSDKALMHEQGSRVTVDENTGNTIPLDPIINDLQIKIEELENKAEDPKLKAQQKKEIKQQIKDTTKEMKDLLRKSEKLIELNNRIILMLDTPQEGLYNTLMSLVSQDTPKDQLYQFAEKNSSGKMGSPRNRLRGTPAMFTTQVIDDTKQVRHGEKNRRFIHVTPNTSSKKVHSARSLIGKKYGLLPGEYDDQVVSRGDKERVKDIINTLVEKLMDHSKLSKHKESGVKIPFAEGIAEGIGGDDTEWSMTVMDRLIRYLTIITKVNMDSRPKIIDTETGAIYPICIFADLKETLLLMQVVASPLRPYLSEWYNKVFLPSFRALEGPNKLYSKVDAKIIDSEQYKGLDTEQLATKTFDIMKIQVDRRSIREYYLYPLSNTGIINIVRSSINGHEILAYPVEDGNIFSIFTNSKDLRLEVPAELYPDRNTIEDSFRTFVNGEGEEGVQKNKILGDIQPRYKLVDHNGDSISPQELISLYLLNPEICFKTKDSTKENQNIFSPPGTPPQKSKVQNNPIEESSTWYHGNEMLILAQKKMDFYNSSWHCQHCKARGDKFWALDHNCERKESKK